MSGHSHDSHATHGSDMKAGFMGLIIGGAILFAILFSIVELTNAKYRHETKVEAGH